MKKINPKVADAFFYAALLMGLYTLFNIFVSNRNLPPGVCPADTHQGKIIATIVLVVVYFVLTFFTDKDPKK